ncbi:MAG: hypothetical protein U9Q40_01850 [Campylobacterota bacterium]|nr:hypothetical protein [Campylobacterota bacterium]
MIDVLKRYAMAFVFLFLVIVLMIAGTFGVTSFGESMLGEIGESEMKPRGENIAKELIE